MAKLEDEDLQGRGSVNFRAPEMKQETDLFYDACKADAYSLGIILFFMMFGILPYAEEVFFENYDFETMLQEADPEFWKLH
eukprot:CAMPEP_0114595710 /NCGR_PEP_ID=MMETSP0125-20121206/17605_1 /TAXON_ID=485358 ORGANISM="Aristerostoma sp., Strain ATCC 50986" /NCGR_SAMPLE_ID=MMETSP0125 /ASSEMBLY_ACC=CAM_ASM_000245 /LENGTH=80 /DNA_ID=CAMNT_0001797763 /DNA_START=541 /DNA_END=783 /DNA_ORIENTATION=-